MKPALLPLTSLRFFAAVAVVLCHRPRVSPDDWVLYERHGPAGVSFFFLLSGFILAYTYHARLVGARPPGAVKDFLVARLARILPAYLLVFVASLWMSPQGRSLLDGRFGSALWQAVGHVTLVQAWVPDVRWYYGFNPPAWSLSCEWFFYLLFPLLLVGLATGPVWRRGAVFAAASAAWAGAAVAYQTVPGDPGAQYLKWGWLVYICPLSRLFDFACGVALGALFVRRNPAVGPAVGRAYWLWGAVELGAVAALWAAVHFCPVSPGVGGPQTFRTQMLSGQGYYLPCFALLVWVGALGRGPLSRVLSLSPFVYLGEISYGIYIFHAAVLWMVMFHFQPAGWGYAERVRAALVISPVAILAVSALSYHFWETPIRRWVRGKPGPAAIPSGEPLPQPARRAA